MAKTRQRRAAGSNAPKQINRASDAERGTMGTKAKRLRSTNARPADRSPWPVRIAVLALIVGVALLGWGAISVLRDNDQQGGVAGTNAIASIKSPDVHSLAIDPANPDHVLFGSHAGIMESRDGGYTWDEGTLQGKDAMSMARSSKNPATIYVTGHDVVEISRDRGATWQPLEHDLPGTDIHAFAQDPLTPDLLFALVVGHGVFRSENGGTNWVLLATQPPGGAPYALAADGSRVYAATDEGIVASSDRGTTWQPLAAQPSGPVLSLAISEADPQVIYAGTPDGLVKSTNSGASWTSLGPQNTAALALAVAPSVPHRVLFVSDQGRVYRSDDGGASWVGPK